VINLRPHIPLPKYTQRELDNILTKIQELLEAGHDINVKHAHVISRSHARKTIHELLDIVKEIKEYKTDITMNTLTIEFLLHKDIDWYEMELDMSNIS